MDDTTAPTAVTPPSVPERLAALETVIERGQQTFVEVGQALMEIRDSRLYRQTHATFEAYCGERWGWTRKVGYEYIRAAEVAQNVTPTLQSSSGPSLTQAVVLSPLPPDQQREVASTLDFSSATVKDVQVAVKQKWQGDKGVLVTTGEDEWPTPPHIIGAAVLALGGIDLDPCASTADRVPARVKFTERENGLIRQWSGRVYMNPPYGRSISDWTSKLRAEFTAGRVTEFIALVPARTDTAWFEHLRDCHLCLIRGRLKFGDADQGAPFPSVAAYGGGNPEQFALAFAEHGDIWERVAP